MAEGSKDGQGCPRAGRGRHVTWCMLAIVLAALLAAGPAAASGATRATKPDQPRLLSGQRDRSFGRDGIALAASPPPQSNGIDTGFKAAVGPRGKLFVLIDNRVLAFTPDGRPDKPFGKHGRIAIAAPPGREVLTNSVAIDSRGRVVVAGLSRATPYAPMPGPGLPSVPVASTAIVLRYLPDGSPDPSFGSGGVVETTLGLPKPIAHAVDGSTFEYEAPAVSAEGLSIDADDRPVIAGSAVKSVSFCMGTMQARLAFVARLTTAGVQDAGFGADGIALPQGAESVRLLTPPLSGRVAGLTTAFHPCVGHGGGAPGYGLLSISPDGQPEAGFANAAGDLLRIGPTIDKSGRILVINAGEEPNPTLHLTRLNPDGSRDTGFGKNGWVRLIGPTAIAVDRRQRPIVVIGSGRGVEATSSRFEMLRLTEDGRRDRGFGRKGSVRTSFGAGVTGAVQALWVDGRNRILVGGAVKSSRLKGGSGVALARYLSRK